MESLSLQFIQMKWARLEAYMVGQAEAQHGHTFLCSWCAPVNIGERSSGLFRQVLAYWALLERALARRTTTITLAKRKVSYLKQESKPKERTNRYAYPVYRAPEAAVNSRGAKGWYQLAKEQLEVRKPGTTITMDFSHRVPVWVKW